MRVRPILLGLLLAGMVSGVAQAEVRNLLTNGSFEFWSHYAPERLGRVVEEGPAGDSDDPLLPVRWTWDIRPSVKLTPSSEAHGGRLAASLASPPGSPGAYLFMDYVEVVPEASYDFGVWVKGTGQVAVQLHGQAVEGLQGLGEVKGEAGAEWTRVAGTVKAPGHIRLVRLTVVVAPGADVLLDDAHVSADLDQPYDADAVLRDKPVRDPHTLLLQDFDGDMAEVRLGGQCRLTEPDGGRFGRGLRMEKPDMATVEMKLPAMPPEGTLECWLSPDAMPMLVPETWNNIWHLLEVRSAALDLGTLQADTSQSLRWCWRIGEELYGKQNSLTASAAVSLSRMRKGQWTHAAIEWDPSAVRLYVDGVLAAVSEEPPVGWWAAPVNTTFGSPHGIYTWPGVIDEVRVSDVRRYGPFAPRGAVLVAAAPQKAAEPPAPTERPLPEIDVVVERRAMLTPLPQTRPGALEARPLPNGDYVCEAPDARPLVEGARCEQLADDLQPGLSTVRVGAQGTLIGDPWNEGVYWRIGAITPGAYWLGAVYESNRGDIEAPQQDYGRLGIYVNGRIVQCSSTSDPVQVAPGVWFAEQQAAAAEKLAPGDEIAVAPQFNAVMRLVRLYVHPAEPRRGAHRVGINFGGSWWTQYTALRVSAETRFVGADGKPVPCDNLWWGQQQLAASPAALLRDEQGRAVAECVLSNPLPKPVTVDYECTVRGYYRQMAGQDRARVTLQPHERVIRRIPFATTPDDPGYSIAATFRAVNPPALGWPETDTVALFPGLRQSLPWPEPFSGHHERRVYFRDPVADARCRMLLDGRWEMAYTPDLSPPMPPPDGLKYDPREVPFPYWATDLDSMNPRPHGAYLRRSFELPEDAGARSMRLVIEDVSDEATAYVNGQRVGNVRGCATPLVADVTQAVHPGQNEVVVVVRDILAIMDPDYVNPQAPTPSGLYLDAPGLNGQNHLSMGSVSLEMAPAVAAENVLAIPSVRKGTLGANLTLANHTGQAVKTRVKVTVLDAGQPVLEVGAQDLDLAPGQSAPVTLSTPWPKPQLWSPESPYLYVLAVETLDRDTGKRLDLARERFGFRETWIAGNQIMFNGLPVKLKGTSTPWGFGADCGFQLTRGAPFPDYMDEFGWPASAPVTGVFNSSSKHNVERDAFWETATRNLEVAVKRLQNHPSILTWDLSNEWLCFLDYSGGDPKLGARRLRGLSESLWQYDPTRWTFYNGDEDLAGLHDNYSFHYVLEATHPHPVTDFGMDSHSVYFPDGAFYRPLNRDFRPGEEITLNVYRGVKIRWGEKVVMDTENLWKVSSYMPPGLTKFVGEDDVLSPAVDSGAGPIAWMWKQNLDGHRDLGCNSVSYYGRVTGTYRGGYPTQTFIMPDTGHHAYGGDTLTRAYSLHNDVFHPATLALKWCLTDPAGKSITQGEDRRPMQTGDLQRGTLTLTLPKVTKRTTYTLGLRLETDGRFVYGEERDMDVWPRQPVRAPAGTGPFFLYDPKGTTGPALQAVGAEFGTLNQLAAPTPPQATVIIGEGALDEGSANALALLQDFVSQGGRVLILAQSVTPGGLPAPCRLEPREWSSQPFVRTTDHPVLAGLTSWDLHFWQPDRVSARGAYAKPEGGAALALVDSGTDIGLEWVQVMEQYRGRGRYLLCQLPLASAGEQEPVAREILVRALAYLAGDKPYRQPTGRLLALIPPDGVIETQLRGLGATYQVAGPEAPMDGTTVALVDAGLPTTDAQRAAWRAALEAGATLVVGEAQPDDAEWLTSLAGRKVEVTVPLYRMWEGRGYRDGCTDVTGGISQCDLYWRTPQTQESATCQAEDPTPTIEPLQHFAARIEGGRELVFPGALADIPVGKGRLVLDQRRWWTRHEKLVRYSTRLTSSLLLGVGVNLEPAIPMRQLPQQVAYQPVDLTPFANRALVDETPDDGQGGWSDQGPTADLRTFPVGNQSFQGVPFTIGPAPHSCLVLASDLRPGVDRMPQEITIPLGHPVEGLCFLHTTTYTGAGLAGLYQVQYADGTTQDIPLRSEENLRDWISPPGPFPREKGTVSSVAWTGSTPLFKLVTVYRMLWVNPRPEAPVAAVRFANPARQACPILIGLTAVVPSGAQAPPAADAARAQDLLRQGLAAAQERDEARARELLAQALAADRSLSGAHQALAESYEREGNEQAALEAYQAWIASGTRTPLPYNRVGVILERRQDWAGALAAYTKSLEVEWNQPPILEAKSRAEKRLKGQ
jgi:hypothetical protein